MDASVLVFALAVIPFLVRPAYLLKFMFQTSDLRPLKYAEVKAILTAISLLFVAVGALVMLLMGH